MSAALQIVKPAPEEIDVVRFQDYLKANLTSDLVMQVLEETLLQENSTYNSIDFTEALNDLQKRDAGRYQMLKLLLEGYATKEGQVMLDPEMVNASYHQRMKELEFLKSLGRFRRFLYRVFQAVEGLFTEKTETEAIKEAIQITGEVKIARDELTALELKKSQVARDVDKALTEASHQQRLIIESANRSATEQTEVIYKESRQSIAVERANATSALEKLQSRIDAARAELEGL